MSEDVTSISTGDWSATRAERTASASTGWRRNYQLTLLGLDFGAAAVAILLAWVMRFPGFGALDTTNLLFAGALPFAWVAAVGLNGAYEGRFVGVGSAEFDRVFRAFLYLSVLSGLVLYTFQMPVARGLALPAFGLALVLDVTARYSARKVLHRRRRHGASMIDVVAVGGLGSLASFATMLRRDEHAGMRVVGACLSSTGEGDDASQQELRTLGIPVLGDVDSILDAVRASGAHSVAVLSGDVSPEKLRWISWQLEGSDIDLVVSPGLADFGGGRLHIQPVAGLPLLHIEKPKFGGIGRAMKGGFDRLVAATALLLLAPVLVGVGLAVRLTSRGPALFRQTRVGRDGREFTMFKFRSMVVDAEVHRDDLLESNESDGLLFKIRADPRVTRVGRVLRRFSLDELPQLINVLTGSMSLVGPRPPLPVEVAAYGDHVKRRLLVKPGLTGLWQVSGRSDLSWDESVRLDLRYVEDWSLSLDMIVLWKTARAVLKADGAY
ncbi:sugar transferase [Jatrophihabitans endophyticus]|uniref:sugar transferase n=1 Tax=Jatrophihabitans endophyticus TaxID=1206085 RepID=UPI00093513D5|nr:sugar transferase [Jatrophihabitans endophyticus]